MILFRYVLRSYLKYVVGTTVLCVFLFVLFDFIHKTTKYFQVFDPSSDLVLKYYLYRLPSLIIEGLPIASLLASVITMILLARSNEITAMRAAGMSPLRIGLPLAAGGLCLSLLSTGVGEFLQPWSAKRLYYVQQVLIEGQSATEMSERARWVREGPRVYSFESFDIVLGILHGVQMAYIAPGFYIESLWKAATARYDAASGKWRVPEREELTFARDGVLVRRRALPAGTIDLPMEPQKLKKERRPAKEMGVPELLDYVSKGDASGVNVLRYEVALHQKVAYYFAALVVSLIGLRFGYRSERSVETVKGILISVTIGVSYWIVMNLSRALSLEGHVPVVAAAWCANILMAAIILSDFVHAQHGTS